MTDEQIDEALKVDAERTQGEWAHWDNRGKRTEKWDGSVAYGSSAEANQGIEFPPDQYSGGCRVHGSKTITVDLNYIAATTHPETGYAAALRDVRRLRASLHQSQKYAGYLFCCARGKEDPMDFDSFLARSKP